MYRPLIYFAGVEFAMLDRTRLQEQHMEAMAADWFDTDIHGPWMNRWEITHHNRHTESLKTDISWDSSSPADKA